PALYLSDLLRPCPGLPGELQHVVERIAFRVAGEDDREVLRCDRVVAALRQWLPDPLDGVGGDVAHLLGPVVGPLYRDDGASPRGGAPVGVCVGPRDDVEGLELLGRQAADFLQVIEEALEMIAIPAVGFRGAVQPAPVEVLVKHLGDGETATVGGWWRYGGSG